MSSRAKYAYAHILPSLTLCLKFYLWSFVIVLKSFIPPPPHSLTGIYRTVCIYICIAVDTVVLPEFQEPISPTILSESPHYRGWIFTQFYLVSVLFIKRAVSPDLNFFMNRTLIDP